MSCIAVIWITTAPVEELALAQRSLPNNAQVLILIGYIDRRQGRWSESVQEMERALELDPRNWFYLQQISLSYQFLRRFADMAAALDRSASDHSRR